MKCLRSFWASPTYQSMGLAVLCLISIILSGCKPSSTVELGPIRHATLTEDQLKRVQALHETFQEVDQSSLETWIDNFKRDTTPESELVVWEAMATAYTNFLTGKELSLKAKKDAFSVLLMRSSSTETMVIKDLQLKALNEAEVKQLLALYTNAPKPLLIEKR